jgi:hypothetical protein
MNIPTPRFQAGEPVFWLTDTHRECAILSEVIVTVVALSTGVTYTTHGYHAPESSFYGSLNEAHLARDMLPTWDDLRATRLKGVTSTVV